MIFVTGGAFQGKYDFVKNDLCVADEDIWKDFHEYIDKTGDDDAVLKAVDEWIDDHKNGAIICDEVGSGIVPMDIRTRDLRDSIGMISIMLAKRADAVYRVVCGIGTRIK